MIYVSTQSVNTVLTPKQERIDLMKTWEIELNHDDYRTTLIINARDENTARSLIMEIERCPARSILSIREV